MGTLEVCEVKTRKSLREFILFPFSLYQDCPFWIPPLIREEHELFDRNRNPAFEFCELRQWMVRKKGKTVGRISGIVHKFEAESMNTGRFGWIDFIDDMEVSKLLLDQVENWFKELGIKKVHGPFGFCDLDPEGMLVEGFDSPATIATIYNYSYYPMHLESHGYVKSVDWLEGYGSIPEPSERLIKAAKLVERRYKVKSRRVRGRKEMRARSQEMFNVLNDSFQDLHGFQSLSRAQIDFYRDKYLSVVSTEFLSIVFSEEDEIIGFAIAIPSLSKALQRAKGRLFPLGVLHILKGLRTREEIDLCLIGVRPDYQRTGIVALIFRDLALAFKRNGFKRARLSAILENNREALTLFNEYGNKLKVHKRRRCYEKSL